VVRLATDSSLIVAVMVEEQANVVATAALIILAAHPISDH
jgi:hypothetical protein